MGQDMQDDSPTAMGQPQRAPRSRCDVRVDIVGGHAVLTPKPGTGAEVSVFPADMVTKRMAPGETRAYFEAWLRNGRVEIGERLHASKGGW